MRIAGLFRWLHRSAAHLVAMPDEAAELILCVCLGVTSTTCSELRQTRPRRRSKQSTGSSPAPFIPTSMRTRKRSSISFLDENAKAEGVVSLPSGLQYKILKAGQGKRPTDTDTVECQYRGIRIDGKEFQSSYARGQPAKFAVASVIPGLQDALK